MNASLAVVLSVAVAIMAASTALIVSFKLPREQVKLSILFVRYEGPIIGMLPIIFLGCTSLMLFTLLPSSESISKFLESGWSHLVGGQ